MMFQFKVGMSKSLTVLELLPAIHAAFSQLWISVGILQERYTSERQEIPEFA